MNETTYSETTDIFLEEPLVYGGFWERFFAMIIDILVMLIPGIILELALGQAAFILNIVIQWLYYALQESGTAQATIGKKALGLKVVDQNNQRITFGQASGRFFGKYLSTIILLIGYLMMIWDARKQTLHDKLASTLVVKA